ncbi:MAG: hypothetical protein J4F35_20230 [Candidatus Latescibacteria bacterium]|nr:hypothetical protein [Candidatus Latescibacterota bacterium]
MRNFMLLTPSSSFLSRLMAVMAVGLLGSGSAVADASDWLPLAVGNSWTYSHDYRGEDESQWTNYTHPLGGIPQFTLSVLRTEVIDDKTYFVISDMPEYWPPVPSYFIAGKKLRWSGDRLMERTAAGEQSLFRFGRASGASGPYRDSYALTTQEGATQATSWERHDYSTHEYRFLFDDGGGAGDANDSESDGFFDPYEQQWVVFLKGFGIDHCGIQSGEGDATLFINNQTARHAVINGRAMTVREARKEAAIRSKSSDATSIEWLSWGVIKQERIIP